MSQQLQRHARLFVAARAAAHPTRHRPAEALIALDAATPDGPTRDEAGYDRLIRRYVAERRVWRTHSLRLGVFEIQLRWHRKLRPSKEATGA